MRNLSRSGKAWRYQRTLPMRGKLRRTFTDGKFGGKAQALSAAQAFRDKLEEVYGPPSHSSSGYTVSRADSLTGVPGVSWRYARRTGGSGMVSDLVAQWPEPECPSGRGRKAFGVVVYGLRAAFFGAANERFYHTARVLTADELEAAYARFERIYNAVSGNKQLVTPELLDDIGGLAFAETPLPS